MFQVGEQVIWSRVNHNKSQSESAKERKKIVVTESYMARIVEVKAKQYLVEFEKNKLRKLILRSDARLEKISG